MGIGIEKINLYAGSLVLDIEKLAVARERDVDFFKNELLIDKKSQLVDYEDVITMAVNAAKPIISEQDKEDIELCIFATESGLDYCKSNSSYVCRYLGLKPEVRNFEIKNACYAATCGVQEVPGGTSGCRSLPHKPTSLIPLACPCRRPGLCGSNRRYRRNSSVSEGRPR